MSVFAPRVLLEGPTPPPRVIRNRGDKKSSTQKPRKNCKNI